MVCGNRKGGCLLNLFQRLRIAFTTGATSGLASVIYNSFRVNKKSIEIIDWVFDYFFDVNECDISNAMVRFVTFFVG